MTTNDDLIAEARLRVTITEAWLNVRRLGRKPRRGLSGQEIQERTRAVRVHVNERESNA